MGDGDIVAVSSLDTPEDVPPADPQSSGLIADTSPAISPTLDQIAQVVKWVIEGQSADDIHQSIGEHWPGVDQQQLEMAVVERLTEAGDFTPATVRGICIEATREIYRLALETRDLAVALRAIRQLWEMASVSR